MSLNNIQIMGRLTKDVELRNTTGGTPVASFTLAVDRDRKDQNGQRETDFIDVVVFNKRAEFSASYLGKGRLVAVTGRLQIRLWTDKDGNKRKNAEVLADNIYFADSKRDSEEQVEPPTYAGSAPVAAGFSEIPDDGDGLPF